MRALEAELAEIPGYTRLQNLASEIRGFEASVHRIYELCRSVIDHNVKPKTLAAMQTLPGVVTKTGAGEEEKREALQRHHYLLREEVLPRVLTTYTLSAYLLRRPDSLRPRSALLTCRKWRFNEPWRKLVRVVVSASVTTRSSWQVKQSS